jgi:hypothetical protein
MFYFKKCPDSLDEREEKINKEPLNTCWLIWHMLSGQEATTIIQIQDKIKQYYTQHPDTFRDYEVTFEFINWGLRILEDYGYAGHSNNMYTAHRLAQEAYEQRSKT